MLVVLLATVAFLRFQPAFNSSSSSIQDAFVVGGPIDHRSFPPAFSLSTPIRIHIRIRFRCWWYSLTTVAFPPLSAMFYPTKSMLDSMVSNPCSPYASLSSTINSHLTHSHQAYLSNHWHPHTRIHLNLCIATSLYYTLFSFILCFPSNCPFAFRSSVLSHCIALEYR